MGSEVDDDQSDNQLFELDMSPLETEDVSKDTKVFMKKSPPSKLNFVEINKRFTYARMIQGISHLKEYERKKAAIHSKEGEIHFD